MGFPDSSVGKESACNVGDLGSIPGLGRSPGEGERLPTPVSWPGEFHGLYSPWGRKESDMTEQLSLHFTSFPSSRHFICKCMEYIYYFRENGIQKKPMSSHSVFF